MTDVLTTYEVAIRVKVSCIMSVDGINNYTLVIDLIGQLRRDVTGRLSVCQPDVIGYEDDS